MSVDSNGDEHQFGQPAAAALQLSEPSNYEAMLEQALYGGNEDNGDELDGDELDDLFDNLDDVSDSDELDDLDDVSDSLNF